MKTRVVRTFTISAFALMALISPLFAADAAPGTKPLLDLSADGAEKRFSPSNGTGQQASVTRSQDPAAPGLVVTFAPGAAGYPGVELKPESGVWDLSSFGHVAARVTNVGTKPMGIVLRVDNDGDWQKSPWNTEQVWLDPGKSGTITVIFGYSYGKKPGYALKPEAVSNILLFTTKAGVAQSFRLESLVAGGPAGEKPPVDPNSIRIVPKDGVILGQGSALDATKQVTAKSAQASLVSEGGAQALRINFAYPPAKDGQSVVLKPGIGRWDLRAASEVRVVVKNEGKTTVTPSVQLSSEGRSTDLITGAPLAAGAQEEIVVPFASATPWTGITDAGDRNSDGVKGTGSQFFNDKADAIKIFLQHTEPATVLVKSITAKGGVAVLPSWLGQRPPVPGDWVKTFDDEFDGATIDATKWNVAGPNYWDKTSRWSKDNAIIGGGVVRLRYEKKTGHQNDDPKEAEKKYTSGYLDTYGKWVQKYGYFEARMKLPASPGLWPAFWLMPDRGAAAGPQWKRQDTANGGMEFDVMEHLTRWGPYRYNIAMHWDGYDKQHKATGTPSAYITPDKDGFITAGLLWLPGSAVFYCNGIEVAKWDAKRISNVQSDIMFTLPMGGWDNNALDDSKLPADFVIDYVRCWQRADLVQK